MNIQKNILVRLTSGMLSSKKLDLISTLFKGKGQNK